MTSFIINSNKNDRLLLLPALHSDSLHRQNCLDNLSLEQLLKADLSQYRKSSIPNYTYNTQIAYFDDNRRSSQFSSISSTSSVGSELDSLSARSRDSIFSVESDDNGFSSSSDQEDEDYTDEKQGLNTENLPVTNLINKHTTTKVEEDEEDMSSPIIPQPVTQETREKLSVKRLITEDEEEEEIEVPKERAKRQRVGPSCDLCRSKKIKCDAHVEIMETDVNGDDLKLNKKSEVLDKGIINNYLTEDELQDEFTLIYSNEKIIKFKSCSYCIAKSRPCVYKRGYTKDDILKYNTQNNIKKKKKTGRSRRRS